MAKLGKSEQENNNLDHKQQEKINIYEPRLI